MHTSEPRRSRRLFGLVEVDEPREVLEQFHARGLRLRHHGPHALRHACATRLLSQGLSFKDIGDHLGHRSADATAVYAKVDVPSLREVARFDLGGVL